VLHRWSRANLIVAGLLLFCFDTARAQTASPAPTQQDPTSQSSQAPPAEQKPAQHQAPPAQPQTPAQSGQSGSDDKDQQKGQKSEDQKTQEETGLSKDRLFWTLPNFLTVDNAYQIPPLTPAQKFKAVARGTFDPVEFAYIAFVAGISQAENSEPGYNQGWVGYGRRYGAAFGDNTIENFFVGAIVPSIIHQDPRYYQLGHGTFFHRTVYAVGRMFITRSDSGNKQFNFSEIVGAGIAAGISTYTYHPRSDQNVGNAASVWGTQIGWDCVSTVVKEFWPDIRRKFHKEKQPQ